MTALTDRDVIALFDDIASAASPVPFTLGPDVHPHRALALGAVMAIARLMRAADPPLMIATIAGKTPDSDRRA
jgi:hypothetical protein